MILIDVNVLIYAHREDVADHPAYHRWLWETIDSPQSFGVSSLVLSGFLRVSTHPRALRPPTPLAEALRFVESVRAQANFVAVEPGRRHWGIFTELCRVAGAKGNLVSDAYFAAIAIESGSEWITTDGDYARFPGLRWRHPLS